MATLHASQMNNVIQNNSVSNQSSITSSNQTVSFDDLYPNITNEILPKNSLINEIKKSKTIQNIISNVQQIPEFQKYKNDLELIKYVCNLTENLIQEKKSGTLKKEIVITSLTKVFNLNENEKKMISDAVEFLINNKKIKKISIYRKWIVPIFHFFLKLVV
jgi:hypothetical protein